MNKPVRRLAGFAATLALAAAFTPAFAAAPATLDPSRIELSLTDPGRTGLAAGRYRLEPLQPGATTGATFEMVLRPWAGPAPAAAPRVKMHAQGCETATAGAGPWSWGGQKAVVVPRPDGARELRVPSRQSRRCMLVGLLAAQQTLVTPPPIGDPPPAPGSLTAGDPEPKPTPPRDPGDPGPLPSQAEPGLKNPSGDGDGGLPLRTTGRPK